MNFYEAIVKFKQKKSLVRNFRKILSQELDLRYKGV